MDNEFATGAGATIGFASGKPATFDQSGYEAKTYTTVEKLVSLGDIPKRVYQIVTQMYLSARGEAKAKGGFSLGNQTISVTIDPDDAGQVLLDAAILDDGPYSVKLDHPQFGTIYAIVLINGAPESWGGVNDPSTAQYVIEYVMGSVSQNNDGIVKVPAA